jgi:hypothetical protein
MELTEDLLKAQLLKGGGPVEIPVHPIPYQFYIKDAGVYNCIMAAVYKYHAARAEAERVMYNEIIDCIPKPRPVPRPKPRPRVMLKK